VEVINAAQTAVRLMPFYRAGRGWHPVDTFSHGRPSKPDSPRFIDLAGDVNAAMPQLIVGSHRRRLECPREAAADLRCLSRASLTSGTSTTFENPRPLMYDTRRERRERDMLGSTRPDTSASSGGALRSKSVALTPFAMRQADCVTILTDHVEFDADETSLTPTWSSTRAMPPAIARRRCPAGCAATSRMAAPSA
jgi:UDP-N-acetyl-D-mannosaminuronate dehydrogenase